MLATINSVWIGPMLGPIHGACLRSFLARGHRVILHVYSTPQDVPQGVELADANELIPQARMVRHSRTGSLALFSDLLRYEIQLKGLGLYVDCDCYCLKPIEDQEYIFGFESKDVIGSAVLKLPRTSPVLEALCRVKDDMTLFPHWAGKRWQTYYKWRAKLGFPVKIQNMPWGFVGPQALTWYLKENGLDEFASSIDDFYPIHWSQTPLLLDPNLTLQDITTSRTRILHLSNEKLKTVSLTEVAPSSPLGILLTD